MKQMGLVALLFLAGCQTTPTFCESQPNATLCDQSTYHYQTDKALAEFEAMKSQKAFALAKTEDGWEIFGYAEGYRSTDKARERALKECQKRLAKHDSDGKCEIIR